MSGPTNVFEKKSTKYMRVFHDFVRMIKLRLEHRLRDIQ